MALIKCKECEAEISSKAKSCPKCGSPLIIKKKSGCLQYLVLLFFSILAIGIFSSKNNSYTPDTYSPPEKISNIPLGWSYLQVNDEMSGKKSNIANVLSTNTVQFKFPYNGIQHATLELRTHPRFGEDIIFKIEKGQILCHSYEKCIVIVKFDEKEPQEFHASSANDNSSDVIFINNYQSFVEQMLKSKQVLISVGIYQEGSPTFSFDVSGFSKDKYIPKKPK